MLPQCYLCPKEVTRLNPFATGRFLARYYLVTSICKLQGAFLLRIVQAARRSL